MYRYTQPSRSKNRSNIQGTLLSLLVLVLAIASISLFFAYSSASRTSANTRHALVSQIKTEVSQAKTRVTQLLPTGGSKTEAMVATVRQHVYAARTVNVMAAGIYGAGNVLVSEATINRCIELLDRCDQKIQTGQVVTDTYNELSIAIDELNSLLSTLE